MKEEMKKEETKELRKKIRGQKFKKYALIVLSAAIVISFTCSFSIEGKDSKLADGQGNIVVSSAGDALDADAGANMLIDQNEATPSVNLSEAMVKDTDEKEKTNLSAGNESEYDENKAIAAGVNVGSGKKSNDRSIKEIVDSVSKADEIKLTDEQKKETISEEIKVDNSKDFTASNAGNVAMKPDEPQPVTVTLEIRCDTLSSHMDYLENPAIESYIPEDGTVLARTVYRGTTENTVFDALNTLCRNNDIQLEFNYTPLYESYYIEGINFLYEFDGGPQSGWMYKVNDWFPNYGCSSYYLSDGDEIVFMYTCRGLGEDVGEMIF